MRLLFLCLLFTACIGTEGSNTADQQMSLETEQSMQESNREVGMPAVTNWQEKKILKWIYELCDKEDLICYAYLFNEREGKIGQFLGECAGYGVPYSMQFSNPERVISYWRAVGRTNWGESSALGTIPQAEPNGLFKPTSSSATWLIMRGPDSELHPVYVEPLIIVSPFKLE